MTSPKVQSIDEYIDKQRKENQEYLKKLRAIIHKALPESVKEKIAWGMPSWWDYKYIAHFDAYKDHVNVYVGSFLTDKYKALMPDYKFTTRGIQLYYDQEIPADMLTKMVQESHQREMERKNADKKHKS